MRHYSVNSVFENNAHQYLDLGAWVASRVSQITVRLQSNGLIMYGFGKGNPLLNAFYKRIVRSWEHVVAPDDDFVERCDRLKSFDCFGFMVGFIIFSISSRLLNLRLIVRLRLLLKQCALRCFRSNSCKDSSGKMIVRQGWEYTCVAGRESYCFPA